MPRTIHKVLPMHYAEDVGGDRLAAVVEKPSGVVVTQTREGKQKPIDDGDINIEISIEKAAKLVKQVLRKHKAKRGHAHAPDFEWSKASKSWDALRSKVVPQYAISDYGAVQVLHKADPSATSPGAADLVVAGYASPQVVDRERHLITKEALAGDLPRFLAHPHYRNAQLLHSNVQVGEVLPSWTHPETGQTWETKVDDVGLFTVVKIRTDEHRPKILDKVIADIEAGKIASFSISADAPFESRRYECTDGNGSSKSCFWIIDKIEYYEITLCETPVNQDAKFAVISKAEVDELYKSAFCLDGVCPLELSADHDMAAMSGKVDKDHRPGHAGGFKTDQRGDIWIRDPALAKTEGVAEIADPAQGIEAKKPKDPRRPDQADVGARAGSNRRRHERVAKQAPSAPGLGGYNPQDFAEPERRHLKIEKHPGHDNQSVHGGSEEKDPVVETWRARTRAKKAHDRYTQLRTQFGGDVDHPVVRDAWKRVEAAQRAIEKWEKLARGIENKDLVGPVSTLTDPHETVGQISPPVAKHEDSEGSTAHHHAGEHGDTNEIDDRMKRLPNGALDAFAKRRDVPWSVRQAALDELVERTGRGVMKALKPLDRLDQVSGVGPRQVPARSQRGSAEDAHGRNAIGGHDSEEYYLNKDAPKTGGIGPSLDEVPDEEERTDEGEFKSFDDLRDVLERAYDQLELPRELLLDTQAVLATMGSPALMKDMSWVPLLAGPSGGWVAWATDDSSPFFRRGHVDVYDALSAIRKAAVRQDRGDLVADLTYVRDALQRRQPLLGETAVLALGSVLGRVDELSPMLLKGGIKVGENIDELMKGYQIGWLGTAQRALNQALDALRSNVVENKDMRSALDSETLAALDVLYDDMSMVADSIGLGHQLEKLEQLKGDEEPELEIIRAADAEETLSDVEQADALMEEVGARMPEPSEETRPIDQEAHQANVAMRGGELGKAAPGDITDTIYKYLIKNYPPETLGWVRKAEWDLKRVPLAKIKMARRPGGRNLEKVDGMVEAIEAGKEMDPIVVIKCSDGVYKLADGYHRTLAFQKAGMGSCAAYVAQGVGDDGPWDQEMHEAKLNMAFQTSKMVGAMEINTPQDEWRGNEKRRRGSDVDPLVERERNVARTISPGGRAITDPAAMWEAPRTRQGEQDEDVPHGFENDTNQPHSSTEPMDSVEQGRHPNAQVSRKLTGEQERAEQLLGKAATNEGIWDDEEAEDGGGQAPDVDKRRGDDQKAGLREETGLEKHGDGGAGQAHVGFGQETVEPLPKVAEAAGVKPEGKQFTDREERDERGAISKPLTLMIGDQDAISYGALFERLFRRGFRDRRFRLAIVKEENGERSILDLA